MITSSRQSLAITFLFYTDLGQELLWLVHPSEGYDIRTMSVYRQGPPKGANANFVIDESHLPYPSIAWGNPDAFGRRVYGYNLAMGYFSAYLPAPALHELLSKAGMIDKERKFLPITSIINGMLKYLERGLPYTRPRATDVFDCRNDKFFQAAFYGAKSVIRAQVQEFVFTRVFQVDLPFEYKMFENQC